MDRLNKLWQRSEIWQAGKTARGKHHFSTDLFSINETTASTTTTLEPATEMLKLQLSCNSQWKFRGEKA